MPSEFPLPPSAPGALNLRPRPLADLDRLIKSHIEAGRYPGCQIALARHGKLALYRSYGNARTEPDPVPAVDDRVLPTIAPWQR